MNVRLVSALISLLALLPVQADDLKTWITREESRNVKISAGLWDLATGKLLEGYQTDQALIPASTTKVISTYALLKTWKPNSVIETEIYGDLQGSTVRGDLVIKGTGDPFLTSERLWLMAQELKGRGIQRITGRIQLDQSAFDTQRYGNGWGSTSSNTTPPILPLSVNFNRDDKGRLVYDPEPLALETITRIFRETGLVIEGQPSKGTPITKLMAFPSLPLRALIQDVNKYSNNFMIEMMVKRLGDGNWPKGIQRIQTFYQSVLTLGPDKVAITDGSGLSKDNRLSARTLAMVLRAAWNDFEVGPEFVDSLKIIGGEPWQLHIKDPNLARRIRCKTGHLTDVTSVCGYLQTPDGHLRVFAILLNGNSSDEDVWSMVSAWAN